MYTATAATSDESKYMPQNIRNKQTNEQTKKY